MFRFVGVVGVVILLVATQGIDNLLKSFIKKRKALEHDKKQYQTSWWSCNLPMT